MRDYTEFFKYGVADLHNILKDSLLVRAVHVELTSCVPGKKAQEVRAEMKKHTFDIMGYKVGNKVAGYVCQEDLISGTCDAYRKPLEPSDTINACSPILTMLSQMKNRRWLFTAVKDDVIGIVTLADLQKAPVRMALFGLVSLLEIHTLSMVKRCYPRKIDIERGLGQRSWEKVKNDYEEMQDRHEDIELAATLLLPAKKDLLCNVPSLPEFLGFRNRGEAREVFKQAIALRNNLVHGRDVVHGFCNVGGARRMFTQATKLRNNPAHGRDVVEENPWNKPIEVVEKVEKVLHHYETNREAFERQFGADGKKP